MAESQLTPKKGLLWILFMRMKYLGTFSVSGTVLCPGTGETADLCAFAGCRVVRGECVLGVRQQWAPDSSSPGPTDKGVPADILAARVFFSV